MLLSILSPCSKTIYIYLYKINLLINYLYMKDYYKYLIEKYPTIESYISYCRERENTCPLCKSINTTWANRHFIEGSFKVRECNCARNQFWDNYFFTPEYEPEKEIRSRYHQMTAEANWLANASEPTSDEPSIEEPS